MDELKFTPGPWETHGSHIYTPDGAIIAVIHNPGSKASDYPLVANRNLMAAAPDLLEALEAVISVADRKTVEFDKAHAALAKAKGTP